MSAHKFSSGELAIAVHPRGRFDCEILSVPEAEYRTDTFMGITRGIQAGRYVIYVPERNDGAGCRVWQVLESDLRKRPQSGIPESMRAWFEVKMGELA